MEIRKDLPFECCENCDDFILHSEEQVIYSPVKGCAERILTVQCKNESLCIRLEGNRQRCQNEMRHSP